MRWWGLLGLQANDPPWLLALALIIGRATALRGEGGLDGGLALRIDATNGGRTVK